MKILVDRPVNPVSPGGLTGMKSPSNGERFIMRLMILCGIILIFTFIAFFFQLEHIAYLPLYLLLCVSITYKFLRILFEWYHYWAIKIPDRPVSSRVWRVDMLTTSVPGEPIEMIKETLIAMKRVRYPHTTYLCDEGNDSVLKEFCKKIEVVYVTRTEKINAKAGNINNALKMATGEICVILDPDHLPNPEFLDVVLPYFEDTEIGYVQVVQAYKNVRESWIAKGAAQQTYTFYGPMMMCMNSYGTAQAIGANCTFRRDALESIGGHAPGLAEDMHTAMQLHAYGWKSVYVPEILSRGLVPASKAAFYKQQIKWSRGTFELLFHVYPRLFKKFTLRQKLHYFLLPLHYAVGIITLIDITIPVVSLFTGYVPVYFEVNDLLLTLMPVLVLSLLIRQYAQKWLLEKYEYGFHISGGILLFGSWWVFVSGFLYTIFRKKVPYIATPKAEAHRNNWLLSLPNGIVCLISLVAVMYGLYNDWNPYMFFMAGYSVVNIVLLSAVILAGQHHMIWSFRKTLTTKQVLKQSLRGLRHLKMSVLPIIYKGLRMGAPLIAVVLIAFFIFAGRKDQINEPIGESEFPEHRHAGGFYTGVYLPTVQEENSLQPVDCFQQQAGSPLQVVSIYSSWGLGSLEQFPGELLHKISDRGAIPMITWEPWVSSFPERPDNPGLRKERKGLKAIADGTFDFYIKAYALKIRAYNKPVFIRFAHEADNPAYPWSGTGGNSPEDYKAAWRKVVSVFVSLGVGNVTWVWTPWNPGSMEKFYPGEQYVDWVGLTCLNYGLASTNGNWLSFEQIYNPFRKDLLRLHKPVMLAEFGSTNYGGDATQWVNSSLRSIHADYPEIKSLVFFNSDKDKNWVTSWRPSLSSEYIDWTIKHPELITHQLKALTGNKIHWSSHQLSTESVSISPTTSKKGKRSYLRGNSGSYTFIVEGKPFYIKGIAYNAGHDWREGNYPSTRRQLEKDFRDIKNAGANTIRRYNPSIYDKNILTIAGENQLKVLYGFWFDPAVDYYKDTVQVNRYIEQTVKNVSRYKAYPSVLGWSVGNETSGLLKKYYDQPYLNTVRKAYMQMIESIAAQIHGIDPTRAVFTSLEHSWQLPAELYAYNQLVPSIDIIGINSYYEEQISRLQELTHDFDSTRPYLVSEFGPSGYWNTEFSRYDKYGAVKEDNDMKKARLYTDEWQHHVLKNRGYNIGGIAFSWRDRFEGTATWFGITDFKGRKKPVYYALQQVWKQQPVQAPATTLFIAGPDFQIKPGASYEYKAIYNDRVFKNIEWHLYSNDYTEKIQVNNQHDDKTALITLPVKDQRYRLYVYVSDDNGNVITASKPVNIYWPKKSDK
ncbi:MAG: glycosyltransferase [Chitinophagaceae bacterium]